MSFDLRSEILSSIAKFDDANQKAVLLLLFGVLDRTEKVFCELGSKIDNLRSDENAMRAAVLNGHAAVHHDHHEWIERRITNEAAGSALRDRRNNWILSQMEKQAAAERDALADKRSVRDAAIRQVVTVLLSALLGAVTLVWWAK